MKSSHQTRHILGLDHGISNQRKIVIEDDKSSVVNGPTGRRHPAEKQFIAVSPRWRLNTIACAVMLLFLSALYLGPTPQR